MVGIEQGKKQEEKRKSVCTYFNLLREILCLLIIFIKFRSVGKIIFGRTHFKDLING